MSASGDLCFYSHTGVHMRVDVLGYFTNGGSGTIVPTSPTRVTDTRDAGAPIEAGGAGRRPRSPNRESFRRSH